jgi:Cobyric acid synthase
MGETKAETSSPLCTTYKGAPDGYFLSEKSFGTYLHGFFDNARTIDYILRQVPGYGTEEAVTTDYAAFKNEQYDKLAAHVRSCVDMEYIYKTMRE